jgi:hypothetical protein
VVEFAAWFEANNNKTWIKGKNEDDMTLLHRGMKHNAPSEVILLLLEAWPESAMEMDKWGDTPLHYGMQYTQQSVFEDRCQMDCWNGDTAKADCSACERCDVGFSGVSKCTACAVDFPIATTKHVNMDGYITRVADHQQYIVRDGAMLPVEVVQALMQLWLQGVKEKNKDGSTPLHSGMRHNAPAELIQLLMGAWPDGVKAKTNKGSTPLQIGMENKAPIEVIRLLVEAWPEGAKERDWVRCAFLDTGLHSRMLLDPTHVHLKRSYMRVTNNIPLGCQLPLTITIMNYVETRKEGFTPLHLGLWKKAPIEVIRLLLEAWPEGVKEKTENGSVLPLFAIDSAVHC